ncbi:MAG: hypothetical protein HOP37_15060 [Cyclobacteriaceae bacterium]|nr:hypothetical protein [Cyclobacteriaceae bacterium]
MKNRSITTKTVLHKISNDENLNKQDERVLKDLVAVLKRSLKGKSLTDVDRRLINETIQKSKDGILTPGDLLNLAKNVFQILDIFKDYS